MTQVSPETVKLSEYMKSDQPMNTGMASTDSVKPKKKMNFKLIIGAFVLLLVIIGAAAGFYLTQFGQDLRQQAWYGQTCTQDSNCSGWPNEKCQNGTCVPTNTGETCPAFVAWGSCDPNGSAPGNTCTGSHHTITTGNPPCQLGYKEWRCGNKNWIPDYGNPNNNVCGSQCPWPETNGQCCPTGVDACNPNTDNYKCIADPFVAECKPWSNSSCPVGQQGYWQAIDWCVGPGCECGPEGLFSDYSGPGCDCGGGGISCNDRCNTNSECTAANPAWSCVTAEDGLKRCRLTTNPTSPTCGGGGGGLNCNDSCTVGGTQCQAVNPAWFCDPASSKCRLQSNPSNTSCQPGTTTYQCNSDCTTTAQCQGSLGSAYSCVSNKCRLTANPTSSTCQPATSYQCNSVCTGANQCPSGLQCLATYDFSAAFTDVTSNVTSVGSGTITGFRSFTFNGQTAQHLVRGGKVWYRPNFTTAWSDATANFQTAQTGGTTGTITSVNTYTKNGAVVAQLLVKGGKVYSRPSTAAGTLFTEVTSQYSGIGSGEIKAVSKQDLPASQGSLTSTYLVRGGKTWASYSSNTSVWTDATANLNKGTGEITDINFFIDTDSSLKHYYVRGGAIWYRNAPVAADKHCRLPAYPNAGNCQPPTGSLQCNSDCTTTAQCQGSLGSAYSCVTNKCRLTANPTSATCEPATVGPMCKDVAILSQDGTELDPKQSGSFYVGQIIKFRCAADDPTNSLISKYQFRITEPSGAVIEGTAINPAGSSAVSKDYQINLTGSFKAQCRICLTDNTCQPYINIGAN